MELDLMCVSDAASYQLGWFEGSEYVMAYNAEDVLEELLSAASKEGGCWKMDRAKFLERDFIPFMTRVEDEPKVFAQCSKLLLLLTQPLECFVGGLASSANAVTHTKAMLKSAKQAIHDHPEVIQTLFREMNVILDHCGTFAPSTEDIETINNCLLVFRNIFHINDEESKKHLYEATTFAAILREGLPDLYKRLISISGGRHWTVSIVQLLSLMFKDATSVSLLLELTIKGGDDAPAKCVDYGDNFQGKEEEEEEESESEEGDRDMSLTGLYMDDNESTGSATPENYDQVQVEDKVLWRLNSGEDLNHALATFGITIMQNGFKDLVGNLLSYLTDNSSLYLDESYLTWMLSYFLKFVFLPKMNYGLVEEAVSLDIVNFLTYQTVKSVEELACEQIAINSQDGVQEGVYSPSLRKVHLCVMALREVFHSLNYISKCMKLSKEDQARVEENIFKISNLKDLKQLFILLLRTCPLAPSFKIYLRDIITTNHVYLLMVEHVLSSTSPQVEEFRTKFSMLDHVRFFAEKSVVRAYGYMLENYELNSPCLNDCIMTMLHHISGDCNQSEALLQIPILNTFMEIYETEFPLGKESKELIEYILCKFEANCRGEDKVNQQVTKTPALDDRDSGMGTSGDEKSGQESDNNESLNCGSSDCNMDLGSNSDTNSDSSEPIKAKNSDAGDDDSGVGTSEGHYPFLNQLLVNVSSSHVGTLRRVSPTCRQGLDWVSECLFESCFAKLQMKKNGDVDHLEEAISYYFNHLGVSIPIVPFSVGQSKILQDNLFITLLKQLGFHFHEGKLAIFPRIPSMWGPEKLYRMGLFLSSVPPKKFCAADVDSTERSLEKRLLGF